jgi:hypothetical protein
MEMIDYNDRFHLSQFMLSLATISYFISIEHFNISDAFCFDYVDPPAFQFNA